MKIHEIMTKEVEVISPQDSLVDAAKRMKDLGVGCLPVCDGERLLGMLTDRDLVIRGIALDRDLKQIRVKDAMTSPISFCLEDQEVDDLAKLMKERKVRRVAVINKDRRLVGLVSLGDLVDHKELAGEVLTTISRAIGQSKAA